MNNTSTILQIVPHAPGSHEGVGDYASRLAERLSADYGRETIFAVAASMSVSGAGNFRIFSPLDSILESQCHEQNCDEIILHYVNYGYQNRGVPFRLPRILRRLRRGCGGRFLTVFHELYASSPPWQSAFWLQPWQKSLARKIARISNACVVSSEVMRDMLHRLAPDSSVSVHPVISTLGEPSLSADQFANRDPHRWVIFGGTHLVKRSVRSLRSRIGAIPDPFSPHELIVLGGNESEAVRAEINQFRDVECRYLPAIEARAASELLSSSAFGWIDYLQQRDVPTAAILKSATFASYCAHGIIPVLLHGGSAIGIKSDPLPGPYFVEGKRANLPGAPERAKIAAEIYEWYRRNASVQHLAKGIATALEVKSTWAV